MKAIISVICPLVCMMTMASARPDNGVNVTPASQTETGVNEVEKKSEGFFSYNAKGVYKAASQRTYKYELGVFRNRNVKGAVICYVGLSVKGNTLHSGYPFYWNSGERLFRFPLSARHKEVKVSACNFDAFHPETTGDVIAERLTASHDAGREISLYFHPAMDYRCMRVQIDGDTMRWIYNEESGILGRIIRMTDAWGYRFSAAK